MRGAPRFDLKRDHNHPPALRRGPSMRVVHGAGRDAYAAGQALEDNPYAHGSMEHVWWERGWLLEFADRMVA